MTKRASTRESLALAFELLKRIPNSRKVTASELHEELKHAGIVRDIRTIQRNLEMLCEHFEVECDDRCKPYGYSFGKNNKGFSLPSLTPQESLLLALSEDYLSKLLPQNLMASMESLFQQAHYNLTPSTNNKKENAWLKKVRVVRETQPLLPPKIDRKVFSNISDALFHDFFLNVVYSNAQQEKKTALVMPLGIAQQGARLYLVCRFDGYENERSLAIHRISKATLSTFKFQRPKDFSLANYEADGRFGFGDGKKCIVEFSIEKNAGYHLLETPLSEDQTVIETDNLFHITATVIDSKQLDAWLKSFGSQVKSICKRS